MPLWALDNARDESMVECSTAIKSDANFCQNDERNCPTMAISKEAIEVRRSNLSIESFVIRSTYRVSI